MLNRRRLLLLALALLLVATFFLPPVYWRVVGWSKGEAFYQGRPTSYREREIQASYEPFYAYGCFKSSPGVRSPQIRSPAWHERFLPEQFRPVKASDLPPLMDGDVKALPVLLELLQSKEPKARRVAVWGLGQLGSAAEGALPMIREAGHDADQEVRFVAQVAREMIEFDRSHKSEE